MHRFILLSLVVLSSFSSPGTTRAQEKPSAKAKPSPKIVAVPDAALAKRLLEILKQKQVKNPTLTVESLKQIYFLEAPKRGISDLTGLEHCPNLSLAKLNGNKISDLTPLSNCPKLQSLDLTNNRLESTQPLSKLTRLQYLKLDQNRIKNIDAVAQLTALASLYLDDNQVTSLKAVANLPKLHSLYAARNRIDDISPLSKLKWLANLDLSGNRISDVGPLAPLNELRWTFLQENKIKDATALIKMAQNDVSGDKPARRFAPYWKLYLAKNPIEQESLQAIRKLGVRLDVKYVHKKKPTGKSSD